MAAGNVIKSGNFTFTDTTIEGVKVIDTTAYGDARGYFLETYKEPDFNNGGIPVSFVQDNQSSSVRGVLRGLHFQIKHPQSKLVRVVSGEVFDVAVDLRSDSATFGKWEGLSSQLITSGSSLFHADSPMAFLFFLKPQSFVINAMMFTIPMTKGVLCGTIP